MSYEANKPKWFFFLWCKLVLMLGWIWSFGFLWAALGLYYRDLRRWVTFLSRLRQTENWLPNHLRACLSARKSAIQVVEQQKLGVSLGINKIKLSKFLKSRYFLWKIPLEKIMSAAVSLMVFTFLRMPWGICFLCRFQNNVWVPFKKNCIAQVLNHSYCSSHFTRNQT